MIEDAYYVIRSQGYGDWSLSEPLKTPEEVLEHLTSYGSGQDYEIVKKCKLTLEIKE